MFDELGVAIKDLGNLDLDGLTDEELAAAVVDLDTKRNAFAAAEARVLRRFDRRRGWEADGAKSAAAWLARRTRAPQHECGSRLALGRLMDTMAVAAEAMAAGEIGAAHMRRLATACNPRTADLFAEHEAMLVDDARRLTFTKFCRAVDYWLLRADPDGADDKERARRERRDVTLDETIFGMYSGRMLLDPVSGVIVAGELERLERELFEADWKEAKQRLGRDPLTSELARTPQQRRADALVEMATRSATAPGDGKRPHPLFTVVLGGERFAHLCQLATGQVVAPTALVPWLDEARLERILFEPVGQRAIKVSRQRRFTGALRRILEVRDQECTHDYCEEPPHRCEGNHLHLYSQGGLTSQQTGDLRCGLHNRLHYQQRRPPPPDDD